MLLSLVTGLGHVYLRHYLLGAVLFSLFATSLDGVFLGTIIESNPRLAHRLFWVSVPCAVGVWVFGLVHAWKISYGTDRARLREERLRLFREGLTLYLRDELDAAVRSFEGAIDRDVDWEDSDALFNLGVVHLRRAERFARKGERRAADRARRRAKRAFDTCLAHDDRKKWRGEIAHEQARARLGATAVARRRVGSDSSDERPSGSSVAIGPPTISGHVKVPHQGTTKTRNPEGSA